jgi:hypothetical protein
MNKLTTAEIMVETGMTYEEAKSSWAIKHPKEARALLALKDAMMGTLRQSVQGNKE